MKEWARGFFEDQDVAADFIGNLGTMRGKSGVFFPDPFNRRAAGPEGDIDSFWDNVAAASFKGAKKLANVCRKFGVLCVYERERGIDAYIQTLKCLLSTHTQSLSLTHTHVSLSDRRPVATQPSASVRTSV